MILLTEICTEEVHMTTLNVACMVIYIQELDTMRGLNEVTWGPALSHRRYEKKRFFVKINPILCQHISFHSDTICLCFIWGNISAKHRLVLALKISA